MQQRKGFPNVFFVLLFFALASTNTPRGGVVNCAQVEFLGKPFRSQRTLGAHPSALGIGVLSSTWGDVPPVSPTSPK